MNDSARRESGHLMLITPERVFYAGLLGRPRQRCPGAFHVYVSIEGGTLADHRGWPRQLWRTGGRGAQCAPYHCQRPSLGDLPRDRAGKRSRRHVRSPGGAALGSRRARISCNASAPPTASCGGGKAATTSATRRSTPCASARRCHRVPSIRASSSRLPQIGRFLRRAGDGDQAARRKPDFPRRASCICSSRRPASRSGRSGPGSARGICCTSPIRTSTSRIWRRTSAIPIRPISAIRSAGSTACSRARSFRARGIWRSIAATPACPTAPASVRGGPEIGRNRR